MKILCFSSFTFAYLDRARVLFTSLRKHCPHWDTAALITDRPPPGMTFEASREPFDRAIWADDLGVENLAAWLFKHDVVEACTAVKGLFLDRQCQAGGYDAVVYLDPDTAVFDSLALVEEALERREIVLTPHLLEANESPEAVADNDISALRTGTFNLGFVAVRTQGDGAAFAAWWGRMLKDYCYDDVPGGLFTDQRWCDLVPSFFQNYGVLRDPGCNVASWNLSRRRLEIGRDGAVRVNGAPLRFWHFTKLGAVGQAMTRKYAEGNFEVYEIWRWYERQIRRFAAPEVPKGYWAYGVYADGAKIAKAERLLYRARPDLQALYPDPFAAGPELRALAQEPAAA